MNVELSNHTIGILVAMLMAMLALGPMGCASSTNITSEPSAAKVRIDGIVLGETPVQFHESSVWVWTKHQVTVEKKGYQVMTRNLSAEFIPVNVVLGIIFSACLFPIIFALVGEYKPQHHYVLIAKEVAGLGDALVESAKADFAE